jgi:hypothetical protein
VLQYDVVAAQPLMGLVGSWSEVSLELDGSAFLQLVRCNLFALLLQLLDLAAFLAWPAKGLGSSLDEFGRQIVGMGCNGGIFGLLGLRLGQQDSFLSLVGLAFSDCRSSQILSGRGVCQTRSSLLLELSIFA